jgi:hypothetical protein
MDGTYCGDVNLIELTWYIACWQTFMFALLNLQGLSGERYLVMWYIQFYYNIYILKIESTDLIHSSTLSCRLHACGDHLRAKLCIRGVDDHI